MNEYKSHQIKTAIKEQLKRKKISYQELSEYLECSVPTIKRILGAEELTLTRLIQLCDLLNLDLSELEMLANESSKKPSKFTTEQQDFLAENRNHFTYLMKLYSGESPEDIAQKYKLTQNSTDKYLIELEKHGLIRVNEKQKVKPTYRSLPSLGDGQLAKAHFENFIDSGATFFKKQLGDLLYSSKVLNKDTPAGFTLHSASISKKSYEIWMKDQLKRFDDFLRLAQYEEKSKDPSELMTAVILEAGTIVDNDYKELSILERSIGEVVNL